ncbi:MAG: hypothetical protein AABZ39_11845 [Spirochaetota bacterium]
MHFPVFLAIVPIAVLLTASFFVLLGVQKAETRTLKVFGIVVAVVLWVASGLVLTGGIMRTVHGGPMMRGMMHHRMEGKTDCPPCPKGKDCPMKDGGTQEAPKK